VLEAEPGIRVVGQAVNGQEAVDRVQALTPDLVTMDLEMPVMGGLEAIERIMALQPVPILVITAASGAGTAFAAISRGAMDLILKPDLDAQGGHQLLVQKVRQLAAANMEAFLAFRGLKPAAPQAAPIRSGGAWNGRVLAIASSTGGPQALQAILSRLGDGFPMPVVIAQHVGEGFCQGLVDWLKAATPMQVKEAETGDVLTALSWLENEYKRPLVAIGFSFGAAMTLQACCHPKIRPNLRALAALGLPTQAGGHNYRYPCLQSCNIPKLFLSGADDQFGPGSQLAAVAASAAEPSQLVLLPRADHFFTGQLEPMQSALAAWLTGTLKEQLQ